MNIQGRLHAIMEVEQVTDTFRKREFVIEYADNPMYPQYVLFQLIQDRVDLVGGFQVGDDVNIDFNIRGRQWNSPQGQIKYFNQLEAWRINPVQPGTMPQGGAQPQQGAAPAAPPNTQAPAMPTTQKQPAAPVDVTKMADDDDLPF